MIAHQATQILLLVRLQWSLLLPDEYDTYRITSLDTDTDLTNLDSDNDNDHTEDISISIANSNIINTQLTNPQLKFLYLNCCSLRSDAKKLGF